MRCSDAVMAEHERQVASAGSRRNSRPSAHAASSGVGSTGGARRGGGPKRAVAARCPAARRTNWIGPTRGDQDTATGKRGLPWSGPGVSVVGGRPRRLLALAAGAAERARRSAVSNVHTLVALRHARLSLPAPSPATAGQPLHRFRDNRGPGTHRALRRCVSRSSQDIGGGRRLASRARGAPGQQHFGCLCRCSSRAAHAAPGSGCECPVCFAAQSPASKRASSGVP
jgi:hypothetical protein